MTINSASLYSFDAGYVAENDPADLVTFADKEKGLITNTFASKASNSPLVGEELIDKVKYTICKGQIVYQDVT